MYAMNKTHYIYQLDIFTIKTLFIKKARNWERISIEILYLDLKRRSYIGKVDNTNPGS